MHSNYKESFEQIKVAGTLAAETLDEVTSFVKPGVTTDQLDKICYEFIKDNNGYSAPLFYRGFPKSCCTSINHVVCHGIPTNKYLKEGDRCLLISENRPEWFITDLSVMLSEAITVPAYTTYAEKDYEYIIENCNPKLIFVSNEILLIS